MLNVFPDGVRTLDIMRPTDIIIAVVGSTGSGKSTFISKSTGQRVEIEHGLSLCTTAVELFTFQRNGFTVHLIDTPGFNSSQISDAELLQDIAVYLNQLYISGAHIGGIIYLHAINNTRVQGSTTKCLNTIKKICGPEALPLILLGSTMWDKEAFHVAEEREEELASTARFWGSMIDAGCKTFRFYNEQPSALLACDYFIAQHKQGKFTDVTLALQRQMIDEQRALNRTDAGVEVERDLLQLKELCRSQLEQAREEAQRAILTNNSESARALAATQHHLRFQLAASEQVLTSISGDVAALQLQSENKLRAKLDELRRDEQRDRMYLSGRQGELDRLERRLQELNDRLESSGSSLTLFNEPATFLLRGNPINNPDPRLADIQTICTKHAKCREEIAAYHERQILRKRRMENFEGRLGVGAGVVGAAFQ